MDHFVLVLSPMIEVVLLNQSLHQFNPLRPWMNQLDLALRLSFYRPLRLGLARVRVRRVRGGVVAFGKLRIEDWIFGVLGLAPGANSLESLVLLGALFLDGVDLVEDEAHARREGRR